MNTILFRGIKSRVPLKKYSTKSALQLSKQVTESLESNQYKPRKHPGIIKPKTNAIPESIIKAMQNVFQDFPIKSVCEDSKKLVTFLFHRHAPIEEKKIKQKLKHIEEAVLKELNSEQNNEITAKKTVLEKLNDEKRKKEVSNWKSVQYNTYIALQYLVGRSAAEYAALVRIFTEMDVRLPNFKPRTFFDFGSGVGTGTWAVNLFWGQSIYEYFCVDISPDMNDLADVLLKNGFANKPSPLKGVFYRQFLPASNTQYDIVLSAYSLLELPSAQSRLETILNLWNKTYQFLVVVEQGNTAGFQIINEVREFILNIKDENNRGHVFMPCPHDKTCPRILHDHTPCNFEVSYQTLPFIKSDQFGKERFSYVVLQKLRKGMNIDQSQENWPRIVRPTLVRSKHTICRICDTDGKLKEIIVTAAKHGKPLYHCARASRWGDLLPITEVNNED